MNTLLIDFRKLNDNDIKVISTKFGIDYDYLISLRDDYSIERVFIDVDQKEILAFTYFNIDGINYNDNVFNNMKAYEVEVPKAVVFDVDTILEKITDFGIDSLTKDEKDYLDNYSK